MKKTIFFCIIFTLLFIEPIKIFGQADSLTNKPKFGLTLSYSFYLDPPGFPITGDIFYKFKRFKLYIGCNDYSTIINNDPSLNLYGIDGGYRYYLTDKIKKTNWFLEANLQYVGFLDDNHEFEFRNLNFIPKNSRDSTYLVSKNKTYTVLLGIGAEKEIKDWFSIFFFTGIGLGFVNSSYILKDYYYEGSKYSSSNVGSYIFPSAILKFGLNFYLPILKNSKI